MKDLKIQMDISSNGVKASPSARISLKGKPVKIGNVTLTPEQLAEKLIQSLDFVDQDGGAIDGDVDVVGKTSIKIPIIGKIEAEEHVTISLVDA